MSILSPTLENVKICLKQISAHTDLNAFITLDSEQALAAAKEIDANPKKGRLAGMVMGIKDNIHVQGFTNTAGTPALIHFRSEQDAPVVAKLRAEGAIIIGKTNMHELAFGVTGTNTRFGSVKNAYNPEYISGGSSGGSAVAVATGMVRAALGTDTAGSIRIPAALNGICGFRPTHGRYPLEGVTPLVSVKDTVGSMARNVDDLALLDAVITDENIELPQVSIKDLRLGVPEHYFFDQASSEVKQAFNQFLLKLEKAGISLIKVDIQALARLIKKVKSVIFYSIEEDLSDYLERYQTGISIQDLINQIASPDVKMRHVNFLSSRKILQEEHCRQVMQGCKAEIKKLYRRLFAKHDIPALIFPTTPITALKFEQIQEPETGNLFRLNTEPASCAGLPGLSIPIGLNAQGLALAVELDGLPGSDRELLAIGKLINSI